MQVAIIGGGAAAVCLLDAVARSGAPLDITVYEPTSRLWRGRPYQADVPAVRLNAPPDEMSVRTGDNHHFQRWLEKRRGAGVGIAPDPWSADVFAPRPTYGEYLETAAQDAIATLSANGGRVTIIKASVTGIGDVGTGVRLDSSDGSRRVVDHAVLCVGGAGPADRYGLRGTPGFVADPFPVEHTLAAVDAADDVTIVGTGLTAIDVVIALATRGHRGRIAMVSRHGSLPTVRQRHVSHELRYFTARRLRGWARERRKVGLDELTALMSAELTHAGRMTHDAFEEIVAAEIEDPVSRLRRHLAGVDSMALGLRVIQRAVPDAGQDVWHVLADHDRRTIMERHLRTVMSLCCPMPPQTAAHLLELIDSGQLRIVAGARSIEPHGDAAFTVRTGRRTWRDPWVINAVSAPADRVPRAATPLVGSMVAAGLAEHHPHGGLAIDRESSRLTVRGRPVGRLSALGDITFGSLFFTFGIPVLVDRAADIVRTLATSQSPTSTTYAQQ